MERSFFIGTWINSNVNSTVISRFDILEQDGQMLLHAFGPEGGVGLLDWGSAPLSLFSASPQVGNLISGFEADFDLGHMRSHLAINENKSLIVVATYNRFTDDSKRNDFLSRQFYYKI